MSPAPGLLDMLETVAVIGLPVIAILLLVAVIVSALRGDEDSRRERRDDEATRD